MGTMMRWTSAAFGTLAFIALGTCTASADRCTGAKLKAVGKKESGLLGCQSKVAATGNSSGLAACETLIAGEPGPFCFGAAPTLADLCLVPQLANARRFGVDLAAFPRLLKAEAAAKTNKAFADAAPERQPEAE